MNFNVSWNDLDRGSQPDHNWPERMIARIPPWQRGVKTHHMLGQLPPSDGLSWVHRSARVRDVEQLPGGRRDGPTLGFRKSPSIRKLRGIVWLR
jgi:hypothetical protein